MIASMYKHFKICKAFYGWYFMWSSQLLCELVLLSPFSRGENRGLEVNNNNGHIWYKWYISCVWYIYACILVPGTVLIYNYNYTLQLLSHLILTVTLESRCCNYSHFTDDVTGQKGVTQLVRSKAPFELRSLWFQGQHPISIVPTNCIQILAQTLTSCVTLGNLLNLYPPHFPYL